MPLASAAFAVVFVADCEDESAEDEDFDDEEFDDDDLDYEEEYVYDESEADFEGDEE